MNGRLAELVAIVAAVVVWLPAPLWAQRSDRAGAPPVSLDRIRRRAETTRALEASVQRQLPVATFKSGVEQRAYMLTLEQQLHKDFDLSPIQRQSQEWRSKCCGFNLLSIPRLIDGVMKRREERQAREQVARELAAVEAPRRN